MQAAIALLLFGNQAQRPHVPVGVAYVATGGEWQTSSKHGFYRVIVENGGWEHVTSRVYVEWIALDADQQEMTIVASALISGVGHKWSVCVPKIVPTKNGAVLRFSASNSFEYDEPPKNFVIELGLPGKYRVR